MKKIQGTVDTRGSPRARLQSLVILVMGWQKTGRFLLNWMCPVALAGIYLNASFRNPTLYVTEMGGPSAVEKGTDGKATWAAMSPTARSLGPQLGAWALCYAIIVAGFLFFEPTQRTHQLMARLQSFIMLVWWQIVWYGAMAPNPDYAPMDAATYMEQMSGGELFMGVLFVYFGFFVDGEEEKSAKGD